VVFNYSVNVNDLHLIPNQFPPSCSFLCPNCKNAKKKVIGQAKKVVFRLLEKTDAELLSYLTIAHKKTNSAELVLYIV